MDIFTLQHLRELENEQDTQQEQQATTPPMPTTKLVNTEIHTVNGVQISGGNNQVTVIFKDGKMQSVNTEPVEPEPAPSASKTPEPAIPALPRPNDYIGVVQWLDEQKKLGKDYLADAGYNRSQLCRELSKLFHWVVDPNSLGKQLRNEQFGRK